MATLAKSRGRAPLATGSLGMSSSGIPMKAMNLYITSEEETPGGSSVHYTMTINPDEARNIALMIAGWLTFDQSERWNDRRSNAEKLHALADRVERADREVARLAAIPKIER